MKKSAVLLVFPGLALVAIGLMLLSPEPDVAARAAASGKTAASITPESHAIRAERSPVGATSDRSSVPDRSVSPKMAPAGSVFAPPQTSRTGSFSKVASPAPERGGPLLPVGGQVLGDNTGFEVDPGVRIPAALASVAPEAGLSEQQMALSRQIAKEFAREVDTSPNPSAAWPAEQARADERFRTLFGRDLYLRQMLNAAREARGVPAP